MEERKVKLTFNCPVKWNGMAAANGGRYCDSCQKVVKDLTKTPLDQLPSEEQACGRFQITQLDKPFNDKRDVLVGYYQRLSGGKHMRRVLLFLVIVMMYVTGCRPRARMGAYAIQPKGMKKNAVETVRVRVGDRENLM